MLALLVLAEIAESMLIPLLIFALLFLPFVLLPILKSSPVIRFFAPVVLGAVAAFGIAFQSSGSPTPYVAAVVSTGLATWFAAFCISRSAGKRKV